MMWRTRLSPKHSIGVQLLSHKKPRANEYEKDEGEQYHKNEYGQHQRFM